VRGQQVEQGAAVHTGCVRANTGRRKAATHV
jgi:hypothetical protein